MISIEEISVKNIAAFWKNHYFYLIQDEIISDEEDKEYFQSDEYRLLIENHMLREKDKHHLVWFIRDGKQIGAASYCIYQSEDGKCFILDYWVFPEYRGNQTGHKCFEVLQAYAEEDGAKYYELNATKENAIRFWKTIGFIENGLDEFGIPLFIKR